MGEKPGISQQDWEDSVDRRYHSDDYRSISGNFEAVCSVTSRYRTFISYAQSLVLSLVEQLITD